MTGKEKEIRDLELLLEKYRVTRPVPEEAREYALASKPRVFRRVMKSLGRLSLVSAMISALYFAMKKFGMSLTAFKMFVISAALVSLPFGTYYGIKTTIGPRGVDLRITPDSVVLAGDRNREKIEIKVLLSDGKEIDGVGNATVDVRPPDLAKVLRAEGGGYAIVFTREGKGTLSVRWKDIVKEVPLSRAAKAGAASPLELLQARYRHVEDRKSVV